MKNKTRKGIIVVIDERQFVKQQKVFLDNKTFYRATRKDGVVFEFETILPNVLLEKIQDLTIDQVNQKPKHIPYNPPKLLDPKSCPPVEGVLVATKIIDEFSSQKYQGEVFFTHKTSPGLIIKKHGRIVHDTKMEDMFKRR